MKRYALFISAVFALLLFGCIGGGGYTTSTPTATPTQEPTVPGSPSPTPTGYTTSTPTATPTQEPTVPGSPSPTPTAAGIVEVDIQGFAFNPSSITIPAGTTVRWTNKDAVGHTVTSDSGGTLDSPLLQNGQSWEFTFTEPGTYTYHCTPHPFMRGTVIVTP